jgi:uncharacterized protein (TIGR02284 family)
MPTERPASPVPILPTGTPTDDRVRGALQTLLTRLVDVRDGLDTMIDRADPDVAPVLRKLREEQHEDAERVSAMIVAHGGEPDTSGSTMSTVNEAVVSLRALFDRIGRDAVERAAEGEGHVLSAFDDAIGVHGAGRAREDLVAMRADLAKLVEEAREVALGHD